MYQLRVEGVCLPVGSGDPGGGALRRSVVSAYGLQFHRCDGDVPSGAGYAPREHRGGADVVPPQAYRDASELRVEREPRGDVPVPGPPALVALAQALHMDGPAGYPHGPRDRTGLLEVAVPRCAAACPKGERREAPLPEEVCFGITLREGQPPPLHRGHLLVCDDAVGERIGL